MPKSNLDSQNSDSEDHNQTEEPNTQVSPINDPLHHDSNELPNEKTSVFPLQRPERLKKQPHHLKDYHCNTSIHSHWCNMISFCALSDTHKQNAQIKGYEDPKSYKEASLNP